MEQPAPAADARLAYGGHPSQFVDSFLPKAAGLCPLAINIHGGFWRAYRDLTHAGHLCAALAAAGFSCANIEYRRAGEEGGGWPGTLDDVRRAIAFAREHAHEFRGDPTRTFLLGHSAGGHLALCMAAEMGDLARVIAFGPVADPRRAWELDLGGGAAAEFFGGSPADFPERYAMRPSLCPTVLIHGTADEIVPVALSRDYPGARLIELAGADLPREPPHSDGLNCGYAGVKLGSEVIHGNRSLAPPRRCRLGAGPADRRARSPAEPEPLQPHLGIAARPPGRAGVLGDLVWSLHRGDPASQRAGE